MIERLQVSGLNSFLDGFGLLSWKKRALRHTLHICVIYDAGDFNKLLLNQTTKSDVK